MSTKEEIRTSKEALWRERLERFEKSGESIKSFCKKEGIPLSTFQWRRRKQKDKKAQSAGFVELLETNWRVPQSRNLILHLSGHGSLEIPEGISPAFVAEVVRALVEVR